MKSETKFAHYLDGVPAVVVTFDHEDRDQPIQVQADGVWLSVDDVKEIVKDLNAAIRMASE